MSRDPRRAPAFRCLLLWSALSAGWIGLLLLSRGELARSRGEHTGPGGPAFAPALTGLAAVVLALVASWLWCVMTAAAVEALHGVQPVDVPGMRGAVRRLVLTGCGVALAASVAPAHADTVHGVAGQPPQPLHSSSVQSADLQPGTLVVEPRDSLWSIAAGRLGPRASDAEIDHAWRALWRANEAVVGADPDHIEPGQRLTVPEGQR